jgi:cell wall-associated NlpC family hydrolase
MMFRGLPYLWAGRSGFGFDCSGLTSLDYRVHGITLPRDASPQSQHGTEVARPRPGDLLAFVNTAGYFMDFSATRALRQPVATKIAMYRDGGAWRWCRDEQYWPVHHRAEAA